MLHRLLCVLPVCLCLVTSVSLALGQDALLDELHGLLGELSARSVEDRADAQDRWEALCYPLGAPGQNDRARVMQAIAGWLEEPQTKSPAKIFLLRMLERVGGEEVVPALSKQLASETDGIREAARRALANNPSDAASAALIQRYAHSTNPREQRNLLAAINYRARPSDREFLGQVARDATGTLRLAAVTALGSLPTAAQPTGPVARAQHREALLRTAEQIARTQGSAAALPIYQDLNASLPTDSRFRLAALQGLLTHDEDSARRVQTILTTLRANSAKPLAQVAIAHIRGLPKNELTQLLQALPSLPPRMHSQVILAVGTQPERGVLPQLLALLEEADAPRPVVLEALGHLGDASTVEALLPLLQTDDAAAATAALSQLRHGPVDARLIKAFETANTAESRLTLLQVLSARRATDALPAVVELVGSADPDTRHRAWQFVTRLGQSEHVAALLETLDQRSGSERDRAEKALVNMCRRLPDQAHSVVTHYEQANVDQKRNVLPLLGRIGDPAALEAIRDAVKTHRHPLHREAVTALSHWPTADVTDDLLQVVRNPLDNATRTRALRAYARVAVLGGSDEERLARLQNVLELAERAAERELALERAKAVRTLASLEFVLPFLESNELGPRAQRTVVDLAHHRQLREAHESEFNAALRRVVQLSSDRGLIERAQKYLAE